MKKTAIILHREFVNGMEELINSSGLPAFVLIPVLRDVLNQLVRQDEQQYLSDINLYRKAMEEEQAESQP